MQQAGIFFSCRCWNDVRKCEIRSQNSACHLWFCPHFYYANSVNLTATDYDSHCDSEMKNEDLQMLYASDESNSQKFQR